MGAVAALTVEIWSDIVCPWCYVGKRRFESALAAFEHRDQVELTWRSFELDPGAPRERPPRESSANEQMTALAAGEGLEYHLDRTRGGNSLDAHRLIQRAKEDGLQDAMKERLMRAYFTDGEAIGDRDTLVRLAGEVGVDAEAALTDPRYADAVRADEELAARIGIRGVPYFVLDRRFGVSGAQPAELLLQALEKAWEARVPAA
jgi:predicted DsbA family dithiol-disulfide isomerase